MRWSKQRTDGLEEEIRDHIERETSDNIARGMTLEEARRAAMARFGSVAGVMEDVRAVWKLVWLEQLWQDLRYATRGLRRNPGFASVVTLTLALGIAMTATAFSVVNSVLLRPLRYPDADRLIWLTDDDYLWEQRDNYVSRPTYLKWRQHARSFESMVAYGNQDLPVVYRGEASQERVASITYDFWRVTGARASIGRLFRAEEGTAIVLSHALFERSFGADPAVIGSTVSMDGHSFVVTGVLEPGFQFLFPQQFVNGDEARGIDAYIAFTSARLGLPELTVRAWDEALRSAGPTPYHVRVVGKLRADVPIEQARAEMETVYANAARSYPEFKRKHVRLNFEPLQEKLVGESRPSLLVLLGAAGFVFLIACVNTANLLLARASTRAREIAIRKAIGAASLRIVRQFLAESILLALLGAVSGLALSSFAMRAVRSMSVLAAEATIDARVLVFSLAIALAAGLLFGLAPVWKAGSARKVLVVVEMAVALVLLAGAGLLMKSFWRMNTHSPGFTPEKILVMRVSLSGPHYATWPQKAAYIDQLLDRLPKTPGVRAAGIDCGTLNASLRVNGGEPRAAGIRAVSQGYLRAAGVPMLRGSWPKEGELFGVLVNESFARSITPGGDVVGAASRGFFPE